MLSRISDIIILTLFVHLFTGCDSLDGSKDVDMWIEAAGIVSVSDDRPAEVVIGAVGAHSNTCVSRNVEVSATREGNDINLTAKMEIPFFPSLCGDAVTGVYGEVTLKNLKMGEYKILDDSSRELGRFRIEEYAAYVDIEPIINGFIISRPVFRDNDELEDTSYFVKASIGIEEVHETGCELIIPRTVLWTDREDTEAVINIDIKRRVPNADSPCGVISLYQPTEVYGAWIHNTEIHLGLFSAGTHRVVIDGMNYIFEIPLQVDWERIQQIIIPPKMDAATPM